MSESEFMSLAEAAQILGLPKRSIGFLVRTGQLKCYRINARVFRIRKNDLATFIESCAEEADRKRVPRNIKAI